MDQETICLSSKSFQSLLQITLKELFTENTFADVTLVSDDQIQIQAHKFVLSAAKVAVYSTVNVPGQNCSGANQWVIGHCSGFTNKGVF